MKPGDEVWVRPNVIDPKVVPTKHVIGTIWLRKVCFDKTDDKGYIGAKLTSVFHKKENAFWQSEEIPIKEIRMNEETQTTMTLNQALRYKKRLVEKIRKAESDINENNSCLKGNDREVDVEAALVLRKDLVNELVQLKLMIQDATRPIMYKVLQLAELKAEIAFLQKLPTNHGKVLERFFDSSTPPQEYEAVLRKGKVDDQVNSLRDRLDVLQTEIDKHNNTTNLK